MIDPTDQYLAIIKSVVGKAYLAWPKKAPAAPYAIMDMVGRTPVQTAPDGSEVATRLTYTIGVLASTPSKARDLAGQVADALAAYALQTSGWTGAYEDPNHLYRVNVTVSGIIDRRGSTFSG